MLIGVFLWAHLMKDPDHLKIAKGLYFLGLILFNTTILIPSSFNYYYYNYASLRWVDWSEQGGLT